MQTLHHDIASRWHGELAAQLVNSVDANVDHKHELPSALRLAVVVRSLDLHIQEQKALGVDLLNQVDHVLACKTQTITWPT